MLDTVVIGVIIADYNVLLRQALRVIVEGYPARIIAEVGDGFEACRAAEHEKPDLVILDISMPVMNGLTAAQHIRALYRDVHIIIVTMHTESNYVEEAFRSGAQGYVWKQKARTELITAMRTVLFGNTYCSHG